MGRADIGFGPNRSTHRLVGRDAEQAEITRRIATVADGLSAALVLRGGPGVGKTALLDDTVESTTGVTVVRLLGIESEIRLGFAALHQLLLPFLDGMENLPPLQRAR